MRTATVTSKGQVTIPVDIREKLNIEVGDQLVFIVGAEGQIRLRVRRPRIGSGRGSIAHVASDVTRATIGAAVAAGVARKLDRARGTVAKKKAKST
jgi:AbrB family looped-hinge helix DNA binding protein